MPYGKCSQKNPNEGFSPPNFLENKDFTPYPILQAAPANFK